jgi:tRNA threonylcarbamoyladenosine biosynthesis protein TsaE
MFVELPHRRATRFLAGHVASLLHGGDLVILSGALGAGKTFFVRALCRALGLPVSERVTSPTFALVREVETIPPLVHVDLYRLKGASDLSELGLGAERESGRALLVEWGEPYADLLGGDALTVAISLVPRAARLSASGPRSKAVLDALASRDLSERPVSPRTEAPHPAAPRRRPRPA